MEDIHFEPSYPASHYLTLAVSAVPGLAALAVSAALGLGRHALTLSVVVLVALPMILRVRHVRRVVFGEQLIVFRMLFGDRFFNYSQVRRIDPGVITTDKGALRIDSWRNRDAFFELVRALRDRGKLTHAEFGPGV